MALNGVFTNCSKLVPCPVCRATDRCSIIRARGIVNCRTLEANDGEGRVAKDGSRHWTHHTGRAGAALMAVIPDGPPVASPEKLDEVYNWFLALLRAHRAPYGLTEKHVKELVRRGFDSLEVILEAGYRTVPGAADKEALAAAVVAQFGEALCRQIPGLIEPRNDKERWTIAGPAGMFIPVRNVKAQIVSLKIRRDEIDDEGARYLTFSSAARNGPAACRAAHFPTPGKVEARVVRITEGELKADIAQHATGMNTISLPGVGAWAMAASALRALDERGDPVNGKCRVKTARIAFDMDADKRPTVARCLQALVEDLRAKEFPVEIEVWPVTGGKGIDDFLRTGGQPEVLAGEAVDEYVAACLRSCGIKTVQEEIQEALAAVAAAGNILPITESEAWLNLMTDVLIDAPKEWEWFRVKMDEALPKVKWLAGLQRVLRAHERARRSTESEFACKNEDTDGVPTIEVSDRNGRDIGKEAIEALASGNTPPSLFVQGQRLVGLQPLGERMVPKEMEATNLLGLLDDRANWAETKGKQTQFIFCPPRVATYLLATNRDYSLFPKLSGIVQTPCLDASGNLICQPGYHEPSGLFYHPHGKLEISFEASEGLPDEQDFRRAKGWIEQYMFQTMPFASPGAKAIAWSLFLLPFVREMIDGPTPMHLINAPKEGTGKGLLNFVCTQAFVPGGALPRRVPQNEEEWAKALLSYLSEGTSHLYLDNANGKIDTGSLALCLTESVYSNRRLGTNQATSVPVRQVWSLTGNNVEVTNEIARRCVWIELDANCEDPSLKDYGSFPIKEFLADNRSSAVAHALTCIRWWLAHNCPLWTGKPPGSYERWAQVMGGVLGTCEVAGFLEDQKESLSEHSIEALGWRAFVSEWWQRYGDQEVRARDMVEIATALPFWEESEPAKGAALGFSRALARKKNMVFLGKKITSRVCNHQAAYRLSVVSEADHRLDLAERKGK